ncbi:hypothetical protein AV540_01680 [Brevibacillus parabrevis]|nr:hypothetical protein AV540_01680 [Brevibacillus parabrevis]
MRLGLIWAGLVHKSGQMINSSVLSTSSQDGERAVIGRVLAAIDGVLGTANVDRQKVRESA